MAPSVLTLADLPSSVPIFPLGGALLLPRGRLPLNIFEPRYLAMVDAALGSDRVIGMIQPQPGDAGSVPALCRIGCLGRIVQFAETGDGRYLIVLAGLARFRIADELTVDTPFRQVRADPSAFADDLLPGTGQDTVDRAAILDTMRRFTKVTGVDFEWSNVEQASNETLVNALSMLAPFGSREKQALLEAATLKVRADTLIALTEIELARDSGDDQTTLQ